MGLAGLCAVPYNASVILLPTKSILLVVGLIVAASAQFLLVNASGNSLSSSSSQDVAEVITPITSSEEQTALAKSIVTSKPVVSSTVIADAPAPVTTTKILTPAVGTVTTKHNTSRPASVPAQISALAPLVSPSGYTASNGRLYHNGQEIVLHGVNWFGMETSMHAPHGLWGRGMDSMLAQMQGLGINALRLPLCPATISGSEVSGIDYSQNSDLQNKNSLQILDVLMAKLDARGMYALLDLHRPDCTAQSDLWYTPTYSESQWLNSISSLASRYSSNSHFIGIDLKNEPRGIATWGTGNVATDWNSAAERGGLRMLSSNSKILAFIEGVAENPVCSTAGNHFWGGNLEPAKCAPIQLPSNKVAYSPHAYGPDVYKDMPSFKDSSFPANMPALWDTHFGNLKIAKSTVVPGEWGGRYGTGLNSSIGQTNDKAWQDAFSNYLIQSGMCSSFYWSWNPNSNDTGGLLQDNWQTPWQPKVTLLQHYWNSCH